MNTFKYILATILVLNFGLTHADIITKKISSDILVEGNELRLESFPQHLKKNLGLSLDCDITSLANGKLVVGQSLYPLGSNTNGINNGGAYVVIDADSLFVHGFSGGGLDETRQSLKHGMSISGKTNIQLTVSNAKGKKYNTQVSNLVITCGTTTKQFSIEWDNLRGGTFFINSNNTNISDITMEAFSTETNRPVWVFGDSYLDISKMRWTWYAYEENLHNFLLCGKSGGNSAELFADCEKLLQHGKPRYILWCLGMTDKDHNDSVVNASWLKCAQALTDFCKENEITLLFTTIPNTPVRCNIAKNNWITNSRLRYLDFAGAVGADYYPSPWHEGYLASDNFHPTELGAKALYAQLKLDFPELELTAKAPYTGDVTNDGVIDVTDANTLINIVLAKDKGYRYIGLADIDNNGDIDVSDVNAIINAILGK